MKRVEGYKGLYRNNSGAIVNHDSSALLAYKAKKAASNSKDKELQELRNEIDELKDLIKKMLDK